jgi:energy-coupling factor transporter ATP-binding protein EcfA2
VIALAPLNVITGPNGSGKSNIYETLRLLGDTAQGGVIASLAREGGPQSTLWAGPESISRAMRRGDAPVQGTRRKSPVSLGLGFAGNPFSYSIADSILALLRSLSNRRRRTIAPTPDRHPHDRTQSRWRRPGRRTTNDPGDRRPECARSRGQRCLPGARVEIELADGRFETTMVHAAGTHGGALRRAGDDKARRSRFFDGMVASQAISRRWQTRSQSACQPCRCETLSGSQVGRQRRATPSGSMRAAGHPCANPMIAATPPLMP